MKPVKSKLHVQVYLSVLTPPPSLYVKLVTIVQVRLVP